MRRASLDRERTLRSWHTHSILAHGGKPGPCVCEIQPGRFRKGQRVLGCTVPRCWQCKRGKLMQIPKRQEYRATLSYREWASEYGLQRLPRKRYQAPPNKGFQPAGWAERSPSHGTMPSARGWVAAWRHTWPGRVGFGQRCCCTPNTDPLAAHECS